MNKDDQIAIGAAAVGAVAIYLLTRGSGPATTPAAPCQLCSCNDSVVACQTPAGTIAGTTCSLCNGPGGSIVACPA